MPSKLLRHPIPNEDESLDSYLHRLSTENLCSIEQLCNLLNINRKDVNCLKNIPIETAELISEVSKIDLDSITDMLVTKYDFGKDNEIYSIFEKHVLNQNPRFCPICLKESRYCRLYWHLDPIILCKYHQIYLYDFCPFCGTKLSTQSLNKGYCINCRNSLINSKPLICSDKKVIKSQQILFSCFENIHLSKDRKCYDHLNSINFPTNPKSYLEIYVFIYKLATLLNKLNNKKLTYKILTNIKHESVLFTLGKIEDWPQGIDSLLRYLNNLGEESINKIHLREKKQLNEHIYFKHPFEILINLIDKTVPPVQIIASNIDIVKNEFDIFFRKYINEYYFDSYILSITQDGLISSNDASATFDLSIHTIVNLWEPINCRYKIIDIVAFFGNIINSTELIFSKKDYIALSHLLNMFIRLNVEELDIYYMIINRKLHPMIYPFDKFGQNMLYFPIKESKLAILNFVVDRINDIT